MTIGVAVFVVVFVGTMRMGGDGCRNGTDSGTGIGIDGSGRLVMVTFFFAVVLAMVFWVRKKKNYEK